MGPFYTWPRLSLFFKRFFFFEMEWRRARRSSRGMASLLSLCFAFVACAAAQRPSRTQRFVDAWSKTGSCNSPSIRGSCGVIVASATDAQLCTTCAGGGAPNASARFEPSTLFEIASITKVWTAIAMEWLIGAGVVRRNETLEEAFRKHLNLSRSVVANITLGELSTHTSGLPRVPFNLHGDASNPYANYSMADLMECFANVTELPRRGSFLYSNLAFGVLGLVLELRAGVAYEDLVRAVLLAPLGMNDSKVLLTRAEWARDVAVGRNSSGGKAERATPYGVLQGQGAFHSSIRDMGVFVRACAAVGRNESAAAGRLGITSSLWRAIHASLRPRAADDFPAEHGDVCSAWETFHSGGPSPQRETVWKSGGTAGYGAFVAFELTNHEPGSQGGGAAVALGSCGNCGAKAIDQLTRQLVDAPRRVLPSPAPPLPAGDALRAYVGCYALPALANKNRQPSRNATVASVSVARRCGGGAPLQLQLRLGGQHGGSAMLTPFATSGRDIGTLLPLSFALVAANDTVCLRPSGAGPLEVLDREIGRRELYMIRNSTSSGTAAAVAVALHVSGWDIYAPRVACGVDV